MKKNKKHLFWIGTIAVLFAGYFVADNILFDGVKPRRIHENGFQANYYAKDAPEAKAAIILIGGGQWGDYWGQEFAYNGFVGLSLPYVGEEGLPELPEEIDLEYFENALKWLHQQPEVDVEKVIVMGASRNAELSLLVASVFPKLVSGVVAYAPSSVSWSNTVLAYNSDDLKPSWIYEGDAVPFIPMEKISGDNSNKIETLEYWKNGLAKIDHVADATIQVEKINGPILLFSGNDDKVWPASLMADMIEQRLKDHDFKFPFESIKYENAGHSISSHPEISSEKRTGEMKIDGKDYSYEIGGTMEGDQLAKQDAKKKLFDYLRKL